MGVSFSLGGVTAHSNIGDARGTDFAGLDQPSLAIQPNSQQGNPQDEAMAMTENFAATAAQTIPVFALAGVIEARAAIGTGWPNIAPAPHSKSAALRLWLRTVFKFGTIAAWFITGGLNVIAEWECLSFLRDGNSARWVDGFVFQTMVLSLLLLVIFPLFAIADRAGDRIVEFVTKLDQSRTSPEAADGRSSDAEQGS